MDKIRESALHHTSFFLPVSGFSLAPVRQSPSQQKDLALAQVNKNLVTLRWKKSGAEIRISMMCLSEETRQADIDILAGYTGRWDWSGLDG